MAIRPCLHFVAFRGDEYTRAVRVFGLPDFIHRGWDARARREIAECDTIVFARGSERDDPSIRSFNDLDEPEPK